MGTKPKKPKRKDVSFQVSRINIGKKKVREVKSLQKVTEISEKSDESELEKEVEEFSDFPTVTVKEIKSSPVLEKVAQAEGVLWTRQPRIIGREEEKEEVKYKETESDYVSIARPNTTGNGIEYRENAPDYLSMMPPEKAIKDTRKFVERTGEKIGRDRRHSWEPIETPGFAEPDDNTKKYISKGDRK